MKPVINHSLIVHEGDTFQVWWAITYDGTTWEANTWADALKLAQLLTRKDTP